MRRALRPHLPLHDEESSVSWACRLALFHTGEQLPKFLNDLRIPLPALLGGKLVALERLATATGNDVQELIERQPRQLANRLYQLRGEVFSSSFMVGSKIAYCAQCVSENDSTPNGLRVGRWSWLLRPFRTCERHGIALTFLPKVKWSDSIRDLNALAPRKDDLEVTIQSAVRRTPSRLQVYVLDRLQNERHDAVWLNSQSLEQGAKACEMLGVLAGWGAKPDLKQFSDDDWDLAGRLGFEVASQGPDEIYGFLRKVLLEFPDRRAGNGPQAVFGRLFQWIQFNKTGQDLGPIRELLRTFIIEEMVVVPGMRLFGEVVAVRKRHSSMSLAEQYNLHPKTMHRALIAAGLTSSKNPDRITGLETCEAVAGEALAQSILRGIPVKHLPKAMNATRGQVKMMMDEGFLSPIVPSGRVCSNALQCVDNEVADDFLLSISKQVRWVNTASGGVLTIPKAAEEARRRSADIVRLLQNGKLKTTERLNGTAGYLSILVDPEEILQQLPREKQDLPPSKTDAAPILGVSPYALDALLDGAGGSPLLLGMEDTLPGPTKIRIDWDEIEKFKLRYLTLGELKRLTGKHHAQIQKELKSVGVSPVRDPKRLKVHLFHREEALKAMI